MGDNMRGPVGATVRSSQIADGTQVIHARIDLGSGTTESVASGRLPVVGGEGVAQGLIPGQSAFRKFGANSAVGSSDTPIALVAALWQPTAAAKLELVSSDGNDTAAGTGARTVTLVGLNAAFAEVSETVTMAGASATAATTNSFIRLYRAYVATTGTYAGTNIGTITIRLTSAGASVLQIGAGKGQTQTTHYTVPAATSLYVSNIHVTVSSLKAMDLSFWQFPNVDIVTAPFTGAKRLIQSYAGMVSAVDFHYDPPMKFNAKTDLWFSGVVATGTGACSIEYVGTLVTDA